VSLTAVATTFAVIFLAELPDKTALASLVLGARYRPSWVFAGVAAAFTLHVVLAVSVGGLLSLLPHRALQSIVAALFIVGAVLLLRGRHEEDDELDLAADASFRTVAFTSFGVVLVAEFGDLTQIATANLAAHYHDPLSVGVGAVAALWAVGALAIVGGRSLLRVVPMVWVVRAAAMVMLALAGVSLASAVTG
jgi:putative Ca2+/H+ antiporter (TMEM165/GDT1 family)